MYKCAKFNQLPFYLIFIGSIQSCSHYDPVAIEQCKIVSEHAKKVLGDLSPPLPKLIESCKSATDDIRGCIMAANSISKMAQCE